MKIYLDIDGVLISKRNHQPVSNALALIDILTTHFDPFWLTRHCKGDNLQTLYYLANFYDQTFISLASKIKPTNWNNHKTEAIDYTSDFFWIVDEPFNSEKLALEQKNCEDRLIHPKFNSTPDLISVVDFLKTQIS